MVPAFLIFSIFLVVNVHALTTYYSSLPSTLWNAFSSDESGTYLTAASNNEGIYYSTDAGDAWSLAIAGQFTCIASNVDSGKYVVATSTSGTYVSSTFGASFEEITNTGGVNNCVSVSGSGEFMISVSQAGLASECLSYSNNFGVSFTTDLGPPVAAGQGDCVAGVFNDAGTIAIVSVSGSGLWMSSNVTSPTSWVQVYSTVNTVYEVAYGGGNFYAGLKSFPYSILMSSDNGNTWVTQGNTGMTVYDIAVDSTGTKIVVAGVGMFFSDNSGETFSTMDSTAIHCYACAMDGAADNALWGGNSNVYYADPTVAAWDDDNACASACPTSCASGYTGNSWTSQGCTVYCEDQPTNGQCAPQGSGCTNSCKLAPGIIAAIVIGIVIFLALLITLFCWKMGCCCFKPAEPLLKQQQQQQQLL
mmetsp:Transcript_48101/g.95276  ORF Transcript_48101/g.95276 Transcript_48101/m.95276 type:complete len:418 (+) Transcript_48101:152-1405(+)